MGFLFQILNDLCVYMYICNINKAYRKVIAVFFLFNDCLTYMAQCFGCSTTLRMGLWVCGSP